MRIILCLFLFISNSVLGAIALSDAQEEARTKIRSHLTSVEAYMGPFTYLGEEENPLIADLIAEFTGGLNSRNKSEFEAAVRSALPGHIKNIEEDIQKMTTIKGYVEALSTKNSTWEALLNALLREGLSMYQDYFLFHKTRENEDSTLNGRVEQFFNRLFLDLAQHQTESLFSILYLAMPHASAEFQNDLYYMDCSIGKQMKSIQFDDRQCALLVSFNRYMDLELQRTYMPKWHFSYWKGGSTIRNLRDLNSNVYNCILLRSGIQIPLPRLVKETGGTPEAPIFSEGDEERADAYIEKMQEDISAAEMAMTGERDRLGLWDAAAPVYLTPDQYKEEWDRAAAKKALKKGKKGKKGKGKGGYKKKSTKKAPPASSGVAADAGDTVVEGPSVSQEDFSLKNWILNAARRQQQEEEWSTRSPPPFR